MITENDKLEVFENFIIDKTLPKYKKLGKKHLNPQTLQVQKGDELMEEDDGSYNVSMQPMQMHSVRYTNGSFKVWKDNIAHPNPKKSWISKLAFWKSKTKLEPESEPESAMSIEEFFTSVKGTAQELVIIQERAAGYERALQNAKQMGQHALYEQLAGGLNAFRMEAHLIAIGLNKYVKEEDIVRFYKQSKKGLRLDWIGHFARVIPESAMDKKVRADELGIFDNYAILHYDPDKKSYAETQAEKDKRRDPILFGLMKDRRVLYFVSDWTDEVCDLTLDQLAEHLGREAIQTISNNKENGSPYRVT